MVNNIPLNGWPQLKDLEAVQPTLDRLDKIEAWKRTVKEETFTGDDITIENALALPARSLITSIEPIQDLHGYDKPWAGGAGKNKFDNSYPDITTEVKYRAINVGDGTFTMSTVDVSGSSSFSLIFFLAGNVSSGASSANNGVYPNRPITVTAVDGYVTVGYRTGDEAEQTPVGKQTQIESGSSATTFAPYSNICPISGRDRVDVDDTGRNIWDEQWELGKLNNSTGATESSSANIRSKNFIPVLPNTSLFYQIPLTSRDLFVFFYDANKNLISKVWTGGTPSAYNPYPTPPNCHYIKFYMETTYGTTYNNDICINVSDPTFNGQYVPYKGRNTATIQLGTTVYGADINWDTGVMTVKTAIVTDMGALDWTYDSTNICFKVNMPSTVKLDSDLLSSIYPFGGIRNDGQMPAADYGIYIHNTTFKVKDTKYTDATQYKTAVTGQTIEYELATPTTIQLTPTELQMLKGYNRVTLSDGYGTIELKALTGANWS